MANRIKELRKEIHMTQVRLSIELEVSQETISAYERQKHYPSFLQLLKMSELFHASIDYIMGLSPVRNPVSDSEKQRLTQLTELAGCLNKHQLELAMAYMQGMLDHSERQGRTHANTG